VALVCGSRHRAAAVVVLLAFLAVTPAHADSTSPLFALVDAAVERLQVAESVAAFKWSAHVAIEDPDRVQQELAALSADAGAQNIDPEYVARVFGDQISATEAIEYSRFADWKLDPASNTQAPAAPADLSASRSAIDALNNKILSQIALNWSLLHSPARGRQLESARSQTMRARGFNNLYQRALSTATRSYCQAQPAA
jgi:chorismate mutase